MSLVGSKLFFIKQCEEERDVKKMGQFSGTHISQTPGLVLPSNLVCRVRKLDSANTSEI